MKKLSYQLLVEVNHGTEENPDIVQTFHQKEIICGEDSYEANLAVALAEAYLGEVTVEDVPDPDTGGQEGSVWDELDAAYQEGVNAAYDQ